MTEDTELATENPVVEVACRKCKKKTELLTEGLEMWRCHKCGAVNNL